MNLFKKETKAKKSQIAQTSYNYKRTPPRNEEPSS